MNRIPGIILLLVLMAGCTVRPVPLSEAETAARVAGDLKALAENQPVPEGPLTLHQAMAHALVHNLDGRVEAMEQALMSGELEAAHRGLLPAVSAGYGAATRSNVRASSSRPLECPVALRPCPVSGNPSTSSDRTVHSGNLTAVWHALDFGVSYHAAHQQADRVLIAYERRRKAAQVLLLDVRTAWWRVVATERAEERVMRLMSQVREALADSERLTTLQVRAPLQVLRYRRTLLRTLAALEQQGRESRRIRLELAQLLGLGPAAEWDIALPAAAAPRNPVLDVEALEILALHQRPELREAQLAERIAVAEVKKAMLRALPGLELSAGAHADSTSFLVNGSWASLGARASINLTEVFSASRARAAAEDLQALERARREALAMAVLTQLHVALEEFGEAQAQYATVQQIAGVQDSIAARLRSGSELGVMDRLEAVLAELEAVQTGLERDLAFAEIEDSFGRIFAATGTDIVPVGVSSGDDPDVIAPAIAAAEAVGLSGEAVIPPFPGTGKE